MGRNRTLLPLLLALLAAPAHAGGWRDEPGFQRLLAQEAKTCKRLMREALKADARRQAWYLADRVLAADPDDAEARALLERWMPDDLAAGKAPRAKWVKKRDAALRELGTAYFHFGETLEAAGVDPEDYYPINVRAHAYGSEAGNLLRALDQAGYMWCGTFRDQKRADVERAAGSFASEILYPPEFDDAYLAYRARWPEARVVRWGAWRLVTDHGLHQTLRLLRHVAALETWVVETLGSKAPRKAPEPFDLLVFREEKGYEKIGAELVEEDDRERYLRESAWFDLRHDRALISWRHRQNPWVGDDDLVLGSTARVLARRHLASGAGGWVRGRGSWILLGLEGAFEGFTLDEQGEGTLEPMLIWRLSIARALREQGALLPWDTLFDMDWAAARDHPRRPKLEISVAGTPREATHVDVVKAQATALVVGLLKADRKAPKRFAKLVGDLYKRDSLPGLDKAMRWKRGRALEEAARAVEAGGAR